MGDNSNISPNTSPNGSSTPNSRLSRSSSQLFEQNNYEPFIFAQSLTSVCLDPSNPTSGNNEWTASELTVPPIGNSVGSGHQGPGSSNITSQSFQNYFNKISSVYKIFKENQHRELIPSNKRTPEEIISLENIPEFFFQENLTKDAILKYANDDTSPILFQKLEHYSTIIEENIVGHVRDKSLAFFSAMSELKQFRLELIQISHEIKDSVNTLNSIDNDVIHSLSLSKLQLQKNRVKDTIETLVLVSDVKQSQSALQLLLSKGDYMGALDLIFSTQSLLNNDLLPIQSLRNLSPQLLEMVNLIEKMSIADFIRISLNDELLYSKDDSNNKSSNTDDDDNTQLLENITVLLIPLIKVLVRIQKIPYIIERFREESIQSIKDLFKLTIYNKIITIEQQQQQQNQHVLLPVTAQVTVANWEECKVKLVKLSPSESFPLFTALELAFKRKFILINKIIEIIYKEIENILINNSDSNSDSNNNSNSNINETIIDNIKSSCNDLINSVNETMQERYSTLIKVRSEINSKLSLVDFVQLYNNMNSFLIFCELNSIKKKSIILRSTLLSQSKQFLEVLHKNRLSSLSLLLENEEWTPVKVVSEFQDIINYIVNQSLDTNDLNNNISSNSKNSDEVGISDNILISNEPFIAINTSLMLLKFINDYLSLVEKLPLLVTDSISKIVELFHIFNQQTYQLILCAGARQTMKLKTITSKHLGLASQCLSFQIKFIPYVKTILQKQLNSKQYALLNGLDKLLQDFTGHRQEIFTKFTGILKERLLLHLRSLSTMDLKDDSLPIPTPPFTALLKDFTQLHKLLQPLLPPDQLFKIFTNIYYMFNNTFIETIPKFENLSTKAAKRRIHNDILHLMASFRKLPGIGDPGSQIEDFLKSNYPI
ncbi:vacuolar protein sorting 54 family protein [Tieghemostelium lacteum]|uniref:Vacuolar protein sorting 54 family protein n=1 Tax=Tieghemostelium lacteum TaxID=361077 RepID=A0A151ZAI6_TIELA|nr:vacuolar protein sorting 54 family protein [Tieghemostelium lacteum]|eukprot:KYQ90960.1 vacuolar protein sorting 54 family protein [Tieghemostelium lacteum]